jgi:5-methylthioadenosine/S-adenosylhomocysteine deaminase
VRALQDASTPDQLRAAAEAGLRDCWARGVTCVADTGSSGAALEVLARLGGRGVCYQEVFGPDPEQCGASVTALRDALAALRSRATPQVVVGVSPHAPFTVSEPLYRAVADVARRERLPVAVHLAESPEEVALVRDGVGPFADALRGRGIPVAPRGVSPVAYLAALDVITPATLCIHCVQLDARDIEVLAVRGAAVAHCPRSNAVHGHGRAPLAALRAAGVPVGLGTDSLVSVPDLDLHAEARAAGLRDDDALRALTLEGARALGLAGQVGSLEVGKAADLAVFTAPPAGPALLTLVAGRVVHAA